MALGPMTKRTLLVQVRPSVTTAATIHNKCRSAAWVASQSPAPASRGNTKTELRESLQSLRVVAGVRATVRQQVVINSW